MERDTAAQLRRRSSKSPDLAHLAYSMHVAAANGDKRRVKRCLKGGILEYSEPERNAVGASVGTLKFQESYCKHWRSIPNANPNPNPK